MPSGTSTYPSENLDKIISGDQEKQKEFSDGKRGLSAGGFLICLAGAILFSTKAIIVKKAFHSTSVDALSLLTMRMIFSLPFYLAAALFASTKKENIFMKRSEWTYVILLGVMGYYLSSFLDFYGLQYVSAGLERLILFLYPTFAVLINAVFFKQPISTFQKIALGLTYLGIGIAYFGEWKIDYTNTHLYFGSLLIFLCAITYSFYLVGSGRIIPRIGATKFTAYAMLSATAGVLLHYVVSGGQFSHLFRRDLVGYSVLLAIIATVIPTFLLSMGIKKVGSNNASIITSIGPVSTIVQAHFFLGDPFFAEQIVGTLLVIGGVLMIGWQSRTAREI
jgi:drug/metabolite transporter (DMT)-like permease